MASVPRGFTPEVRLLVQPLARLLGVPDLALGRSVEWFRRETILVRAYRSAGSSTGQSAALTKRRLLVQIQCGELWKTVATRAVSSGGRALP